MHACRAPPPPAVTYALEALVPRASATSASRSAASAPDSLSRRATFSCKRGVDGVKYLAAASAEAARKAMQAAIGAQ